MLKNKLRVLRAERRSADGKGWSQMDVARKADIAPFRYWQIENGYIAPTDDERDTLARLFDAEPTDAFPRAVAS